MQVVWSSAGKLSPGGSNLDPVCNCPSLGRWRLWFFVIKMLSISPVFHGIQGDWKGQRVSEKVNMAEEQNGVN
jgi:hypothetical protein